MTAMLGRADICRLLQNATAHLAPPDNGEPADLPHLLDASPDALDDAFVTPTVGQHAPPHHHAPAATPDILTAEEIVAELNRVHQPPAPKRHKAQASTRPQAALRPNADHGRLCSPADINLLLGGTGPAVHTTHCHAVIPQPPFSTREQMLTEFASDTSPLALRPRDLTWMATMCDATLGALQDAYAPSTNKLDRGYWRRWVSYCNSMGTPAWRTNIGANLGLDPVGHRREVFLMASAVIYFHRTMSPRSHADVAALPQSAMNVLLGVARVHKQHFIATANSKFIAQVVKGLTREFLSKHGHLRLIPRRAKPMLRRYILDLLAIQDGQQLPNRTPMRWTTVLGRSWRGIVTVLAQAGFRGDELVCANGRGLTLAHVAFKINGILYRLVDAAGQLSIPPAAALLSMGLGDCLVLTPPPSKSDQFGIVWGALPIYLPFDADAGCAARAVRDLILHCPPPPGSPASTPLFRRNDGTSWTKNQLDNTLRLMLSMHRSPTELQGLSLHSFRVALACQLLECGASPAQIQALLRWQTDESLRSYARLSEHSYGRWLTRARAADITNATTSRLPVVDGWMHWQALHDANLQHTPEARAAALARG